MELLTYSTLLGLLTVSVVRVAAQESGYCSPGELIEIEFKLRFGCNTSTHIDQGLRLEIGDDQWSPIRFYTPSLVAASEPSLVTLLSNNSVRANASGYMSEIPLAHVNTTDTITVREYACGRFISLLRNGQLVRLRWMQRYLTNAEDGLAATWFLDDIHIRAWNGDCFVPLFVEDFATADSPPTSTIDGTSYRILGGHITENSCEEDCASGNSALYFNQAGALRTGAYRRSFLLLIHGSDRINSCGTTSDGGDTEGVCPAAPDSAPAYDMSVACSGTQEEAQCECGSTRSLGEGVACDSVGNIEPLVTNTEPPPTTTEPPPTTTEPPPTTTEPPPTTTEPPPTTTEPPLTTTEPPPTTTEPSPTTTEPPPTTTEPPPTTTELPPTTTEPPPTTTEAPPTTAGSPLTTTETMAAISEGGVIIVNDTVVADPLFTIPIRIMNPDTFGLDPAPFLCYEVHGRGNMYFNLISDRCVSVNAHFITVGPFNVINQVAVRAVDDGNTCRNILVDAENACSAAMDGASIDEYSQAGVSVRVFKERVRISVPNCDNQKLVMWVICEHGSLRLFGSDSDRTVYEARMIKFVVARGFNLQPTSHGIIGQFWNVPVTAERYQGTLSNGRPAEGYFRVSVSHPDSPTRNFPGFFWPLSWEGRQEPCLYSGSNNAGSTHIIDGLEDAVIEGRYSDYIVSEAFGTEYVFSRFTDETCN